MDKMEKQHEELKHKIDRLTWTLAGAALTFGTASVVLVVNLILR